MNARRTDRARPKLVPLALLVAASAAAGCAEPPGDSEADRRIRERAAVHFASGTENSQREFERALEALAPLVERPSPEARDLLWKGVIEFELGRIDDARASLRRAIDIAPDLAGARYVLGYLESIDGRYTEAGEHLRRAVELAPADVPARLALFHWYYDENRLGEARATIAPVIAEQDRLEPSWRFTALYRYQGFLRDVAEGEDDPAHEEAERLNAELNRLKELGVEAPSDSAQRQGHLARIEPPRAAATRVDPPSAPVPLDEPARVLSTEVQARAGVRGVAVVDLVDDWPPSDAGTETPEPVTGPVEDVIGAVDVLVWGAGGVEAYRQGPDGSFERELAYEGPVEVLRWNDLEQDGDLDLLVVAGSELRGVEQTEEGFEPIEIDAPALPGTPASFEVVDVDHDGIADLALVGAFGARLWQGRAMRVEDKAVPLKDVAFADVTVGSGLPTDRAFAWVVPEDYDMDQDVDLLLGGPEGLWLASSLRLTRFADRSEDLGGMRSPDRPFVADVTRDGLPDLWTAGPEPALHRARRAASYERVPAEESGELDPIFLDEPTRALADLDGDGTREVVRVGEGVLELVESRPTGESWARVALRGRLDTVRAIGAIVEIRSGDVYRRVHWRGEPRTVPLGDARSIDWLMVTWPHGVNASLFDAPANQGVFLEQSNEDVGSCPFLYAWNGERFEFVTDVLGITPLGLPMAPGVIVPPDHDEYVLIRGDRLAPRDGEYVLQITEELREVTYLDRARLDVVDHPAGTEIYPNERFTFPPFPEPHTHTVRAPLSPGSAVGSDGEDWSGALAAIDGELAIPFELQPRRYRGLAEPWFVELAFDPETVAGAPRLRLLMTGFLRWTDASRNLAAARSEGVDFVPPILEVPDGAGGWVETGPPVGFPAGKTKTMVVDVTDLLDREDPRLRVASTLALYWDSIRLAVDADDAPIRTTSLEASGARLWERGFSAPILTHGEHALQWFEWDRTTERPRWDPHPGSYTRLGDVRPLLLEIDDRFVVMGAGDALELRFDASALPPVPDGHARDFLLFLDGWAKDRDPNTHEALYVEPLPFHGMSGYPYGPGEHYPRDAEHVRYRREWNTRAAERRIERLAPEG